MTIDPRTDNGSALGAGSVDNRFRAPTPERAYTQGRNAYCDGIERDKNPHKQGTGSWEDWDLGWIETKENDPLEDGHDTDT